MNTASSSIESQRAAAACAKRRQQQAKAAGCSPATKHGPIVTKGEGVTTTTNSDLLTLAQQERGAAAGAKGGNAVPESVKPRGGKKHGAKKADPAPAPPRRTCKLAKGATASISLFDNGASLSPQRRTVAIGPNPIKAAADWKTRPNAGPLPKGRYDDGLATTWTGHGVATARACRCCGNADGTNLQIYENSGFSYPNGNSWDDAEIVCGACKHFTYETRFEEG